MACRRHQLKRAQDLYDRRLDLDGILLEGHILQVEEHPGNRVRVELYDYQETGHRIEIIMHKDWFSQYNVPVKEGVAFRSRLSMKWIKPRNLTNGQVKDICDAVDLTFGDME